MDACVASSPGMMPQAVLGKWLGSDEKTEPNLQMLALSFSTKIPKNFLCQKSFPEGLG